MTHQELNEKGIYLNIFAKPYSKMIESPMAVGKFETTCITHEEGVYFAAEIIYKAGNENWIIKIVSSGIGHAWFKSYPECFEFSVNYAKQQGILK
jgi:hypothetical protein